MWIRLVAGRLVGRVMVLGVLGLGCSSPTEVLVHFDAPSNVRAAATTLEIRWARPGDTWEMRSRTIGGAAAAASWPAVLPLSPKVDEELPAHFTVEGRLFDATHAELALVRARTHFAPNERREVWLHFDVECLGGGASACLSDETCSFGECVGACLEPLPLGAVTRSEPLPCERVAPPLYAPSNVPLDRSFDASAPPLDVRTGETVVIDTDDGRIVRWAPTTPGGAATEIIDTVADLDAPNPRRCVRPAPGAAVEVLRPGGPCATATCLPFERVEVDGAEVGVVDVGELRVARDGFVVAIGSVPLVVLVAAEAVIEGMVAAGADWICDEARPGAGGGEGGMSSGSAGAGPGGGHAGRHDEASTSTRDGGGGGGSFGGTGGRGADLGFAAAAGGEPGMRYPPPEVDGARLVPLLGGSGGGFGPLTMDGGNGGGAVQLSSVSAIRLAPSGRIDARGGGGRGALNQGGGGGGSGGAILLEAPEVAIAGRVGANGGAGGRSTNLDSVDASRDGPPGATDMAGVTNVAPAGGASGGAGSSPTGNAGDGESAGNGPGGGGGGGRIRVNVAPSSACVADPESCYGARVLPDLTSGLATVGTVSTP